MLTGTGSLWEKEVDSVAGVLGIDKKEEQVLFSVLCRLLLVP